MKAVPLYVALAHLCRRYRNTSYQFALGHPHIAEHCLEEAHRLVKEHLPSGSGFDAGTELVIDVCDASTLVFKTAFHHMDEHGGYDGWSEHKVKAVAEFGGLDVMVTGRDRNDIKEYIGETFYQALSQEVVYREMPDSPEPVALTKEQRAKAVAASAYLNFDDTPHCRGAARAWSAYQTLEKAAESEGSDANGMDALIEFSDDSGVMPWGELEHLSVGALLGLVDTLATAVMEEA